MKPTIGRTVHYHRYGGSLPTAAIVTLVNANSDKDRVSLTIFEPDVAGKVESASFVPLGEGPLAPDGRSSADSGECWRWPPREPATLEGSAASVTVGTRVRVVSGAWPSVVGKVGTVLEVVPGGKMVTVCVPLDGDLEGETATVTFPIANLGPP